MSDMTTEEQEALQDDIETYVTLSSTLATENKRLREALKKALDCTHPLDDMDEWRDEAKEALKERDDA